MKNARITLLTTLFLLALGSTASAEITRYVYVSGVCSDKAIVRTSSGALVARPTVRQTHSQSTAVADLKNLVATYCRGSYRCRLYGKSNGAATISRMLDEVSSSYFNLYAVYNAAGNEGGSWISISPYAWIGSVFGNCPLLSNISPSTHRSWNHNDTNGKWIYQKAGKYSPFNFLVWPWVWWEGKNDSMVTYNSACGYASEGWFRSTCAGSGRWSYHTCSNCSGYNLWHMDMNSVWWPYAF